MRPLLKYNNRNGAILCKKCRVIIKENLTKAEWRGITDLYYCDKCRPKTLEDLGYCFEVGV